MNLASSFNYPAEAVDLLKALEAEGQPRLHRSILEGAGMKIKTVLACLDGSLFAEKIIPYARGIARPIGAQLTLLRVVEEESEFSAALSYVQGLAQRLGVEGQVKMVQLDSANTILEELRQNPKAIVAMTTHGRTALPHVLLGSVALKVIRESEAPVLVYRPPVAAIPSDADTEVKITSVVVTLDGSEFSEAILPLAAEMAVSLKARPELVQVLELKDLDQVPKELRAVALESGYVYNQAEDVRRQYGLDASWEVLHGRPGDAICEYVQRRHDVILVMSTHARSGFNRVIFGSVTSECVRRAGVPVLVYRPHRSRTGK